MQKLKKYWFPVIFWCLVIFGFSQIPEARIAPQKIWDLLIRKLAHFTEYAILYVLVFRATKNKIWGVLFAFFYAITDEIHQLFVPGRNGSARDVLIDTAGAVFALTILWKFSQILPKRLLNWAKS